MSVNEECIHISYREEAGGWLICDNCGKDVTLQIYEALEYQDEPDYE